MITFFACPREFKGIYDVIQRNAIQSWPGETIILAEPETNVSQTAAELNLTSYEVKLSEEGIPLVNHIFYKGFDVARTELTCYVNADIILFPSFVEAAKLCAQSFDKFLMIGQRTDMDLSEEIDFSEGWGERVLESARLLGDLHPTSGIDYFCSPGNIWGKIPPFALGRYAWDNWLVATPLMNDVPVVDATEYVTAIHQNHKRHPYHSPEASRNREMMGNRLAGVGQANWKITSEGGIERK